MMGSRRRNCETTCTRREDGRIVPWLSATGPLSYTPESPPMRDRFFQYTWILPGIFAPHTNLREHHYFGARHKDQSRDLFRFWEGARRGDVDPVAVRLGMVGASKLTAPLAVYRTRTSLGDPAYLFIQHGSYQLLRVTDQPLLGQGQLLLHRGIFKDTVFRLPHFDADTPGNASTWSHYGALVEYVLTDSVRSFTAVHDRVKRAETGHIRDQSWLTDDLARSEGLDIDGDPAARSLWSLTHQSFSLARWVADRKFGPNHVVFRTPMDNVHLTTFFVGEHEVRVLDPRLLEVHETVGCSVNSDGSDADTSRRTL